MNEVENDTSFSSLTFCSTIEETDISSCSEVNISQLQNEILKETQQIQNFLQKPAAEEESVSFSMLKSLFTLFKSELALNLSLRKLLMRERNTNRTVSTGVDNFMKTVRSFGFTDARDFASILKYLQIQHKKIKKLEVIHKSYKKLQKENEILVDANGDLENRISTMEGEYSMNLAESYSNCERLKAQLDSMSSQYQRVIQENMDLKKANSADSKFISELRKKQNENENIIQSLNDQINSLQAEKLALEKQNADRTSELIILNSKNEQATQLNEQKVTNMQQQYAQEIDHLKKHYTQEHNFICSQHSKEVETLNNQLNELKHNYDDGLQKKNEEIIELTGKVFKLKNTCDVHEKELSECVDQQQQMNELNDKLSRIVKKQNKRIKYLDKQLQITTHEHDQSIKEHTEEIDKMKSDCAKREKYIKTKYEQELRNKSKQHANIEQELRIVLDEQLSENKKLKCYIQKLSFSLEQEEAEIARLQTSIQMMKKYPKHKKTPFSSSTESSDNS